jgi:NADPH2:quinone reductase
MKAALIDNPTGIDTIRIGEIEIAPPTKDEVQIDVRASSVNFPDILMSEGNYQLKPPLPFTPGMEGAGTVTAVGPGVTEFKIGDRVLASVEFGTFAERLNAPASRCVRVPEAVSFETAAAVGLAYQTAYFALRERGQMTADDVVLVNGATGGVGLAAIRLAKALGAKTVIGSVATPAKASIVTDAGADAIVYVDTKERTATLKDQVAAATGGRPADLVIETVGGEVFDASLRALAFRGRLVVVGFAGGSIPVVKSNYILLKNISLVGLHWALHPAKMPEEVKRAQSEIFDLLIAGKLDANIGATYPLSDIRTALAAMKERNVRGKIVVRI